MYTVSTFMYTASTLMYTCFATFLILVNLTSLIFAPCFCGGQHVCPQVFSSHVSKH